MVVTIGNLNQISEHASEDLELSICFFFAAKMRHILSGAKTSRCTGSDCHPPCQRPKCLDVDFQVVRRDNTTWPPGAFFAANT